VQLAGKARLTKWFGKQCVKKVKQQTGKRLHKAGLHFVNACRRNISTKGSKCGKNTGTRSAPEGFPYVECGHLKASLTYEVDEKKQRVLCGSNLKYAKYLELSTKHMSARPFLRPTLKEEQGRIKNILAGKKLDGF